MARSRTHLIKHGNRPRRYYVANVHIVLRAPSCDAADEGITSVFNELQDRGVIADWRYIKSKAPAASSPPSHWRTEFPPPVCLPRHICEEYDNAYGISAREEDDGRAWVSFNDAVSEITLTTYCGHPELAVVVMPYDLTEAPFDEDEGTPA